MNLKEKAQLDGAPKKQAPSPSKAPSTAQPKTQLILIGVFALIAAIAAVVIIVPKLGGVGHSDALTPDQSVILYQVDPDSEPIEVDVASLLTKVDDLEEQVTNLRNNPASDTGIAYMPEGVSALAEFDTNNADFLNTRSLYQVKEPIPYKKMYIQLSDAQYGFYALIDYGGAKSLIPIHYTDYKDLKPEGVTYFNVEYATTRPENSDVDKGLTVGITIDPKWRENLQANYN